MSVETKATIRFTNTPTFGERIALRIIGLGVIMLTDNPARNLARYFGTLWNMGCWTLSAYPVAVPVGTEPVEKGVSNA